MNITHERGTAEVAGAPEGDFSGLEGSGKEILHGIEPSVYVTEKKGFFRKDHCIEKKEV
ncbi:MAG: hypothetical protein JRJ71_07490 [Deltaproteobacteria bacterium]|nr:hypothetical protein [Deltaproteobacteria bacterium]